MKGMGSDLSLEDWFPKSMAPAAPCSGRGMWLRA